MKNIFILFITCVSIYNSFSQTISITDKFNLPLSIEESSGLIYYNNKLITHNDSGNTPQLFELDTISGAINRTVTVSNATNVDWEDIAQDDSYIYVGDLGNNNGNRTDLKIYRISKTDYEASTSVIADIINFSYADQIDFTSNPNNTNWDAEGLVVWGNYLFIFSKNWINNEVDLYVISKNPGTYSATKEGSFNAQGLITGVDTSLTNNKLYFSGYSSSSVTPFIIMFYNIDINPPTNFDVFSNSQNFRFDPILPLGNQVEGICFIEQNSFTDRLFISNEKLVIGPLAFAPKLRVVDVNNEILSLVNVDDNSVKIFPNPFIDSITLSQRANTIIIYDALGRMILSQMNALNINTTQLNSGWYYLKVTIGDNSSIFKIIK